MASLATLIHAATGVPRLYAAALRAGAGPLEATRVLAVASGALAVAARRGAGVPGRQNAVRHFAWQALLTARHGLPLARVLAEAQEAETANVADSRVDRHNNVVGQEYGAAHAAELSTGSVTAALETLADVALAKWDSDDLIWVRGR